MTVPNSTNKDLAIKDEAVRYIWAGWFIFVLSSSLVGDTIILIASIKYKAIKLHKMMVVIIQHIAVSDLVISLGSILTPAISLVTNKWTFGPVICYPSLYLRYLSYNTGSFLVCGMVTCKLLILKYPLRSLTWSAGRAHKICFLIWLLSLYWPICFLVSKDDVLFDYRAYICQYEFSSNVRRFTELIGIAIFVIAPTIIIIVTSVMILAFARKVANESRQGMKWQGVMTSGVDGSCLLYFLASFASL